MDFRLQSHLAELLKSLDMDDGFDLISVGGSTKALTTPNNPSNREFLLDQIGISVDLHQVECIMIFHHQDCGAYGGSDAFDSPDKEREHHISDMKKAKEAILEKYSDVRVELYYIKMDGSRWSFEKTV